MLLGLPVTLVSPKGLEFPRKTCDFKTKRNEPTMSLTDHIVNIGIWMSGKLGKFRPIRYDTKWPKIQTQRDFILLELLKIYCTVSSQ